MEDVLDILAHTAEGVFAVDGRQRLVFCNEAAAQLLDCDVSQALGGHCYTLMRGKDDAGRRICLRDCPCVQMVRRGEQIPTGDMQIHTIDGRSRWVTVITILMPARRRRDFLLVHLFHDVSRQKAIEALARKLTANLDSPAGLDLRKKSPTATFADLTARESHILKLLASGLSTRRIADELFISVPTVRNHVQNTLTKLDVHSRLEAVARALRRRLI